MQDLQLGQPDPQHADAGKVTAFFRLVMLDDQHISLSSDAETHGHMVGALVGAMMVDDNVRNLVLEAMAEFAVIQLGTPEEVI